MARKQTHKQIKTKIALLLVALQVATFAPLGRLVAEAENRPMETRKLLVTAYYSPLPGQSFYIKGSLEADIILNGRGTNGADGTEVYEGMLAAPKTYPFGTRVKIPGLGVGEVHDRGGAIVARSGYDRIDVWMGRGEEGLARALNWGARFVEGEVYFTPHQVQPGLDFGWVSGALPATFVKRLQNKPLQNPAVFNNPITQVSASDDIKQLQEALTTFGYYTGEVNGIYDSATTKAVLAFQMAESVIPHEGAQGAGVFGPKTRETLKAKLETHNDGVMREYKRLEENRLLLEAGLGKEAEGDEVRALQRMLWELGYYDGELNGDYDATTMDSVFEFQKSQGILSSEYDAGAGYYGKQTHSALTAAIQKKMNLVKNFKPVEMQVWVPAKLELPTIASLNPPELSLERQELHLAAEIKFTEEIKLTEEVVLDDSNFTRDLNLNDDGDEVRALQNLLIKSGHLADGLATGYYGEKTQAAVLNFQLEKGIVASASDTGAGRVGPSTRTALNSL